MRFCVLGKSFSPFFFFGLFFLRWTMKVLCLKLSFKFVKVLSLTFLKLQSSNASDLEGYKCVKLRRTSLKDDSKSGRSCKPTEYWQTWNFGRSPRESLFPSLVLFGQFSFPEQTSTWTVRQLLHDKRDRRKCATIPAYGPSKRLPACNTELNKRTQGVSKTEITIFEEGMSDWAVLEKGFVLFCLCLSFVILLW